MTEAVIFPAGASWSPESSRKLTDILVIEATLELLEPTHIGGHPDAGSEVTDLPLLTTPDGRPLLLGTSIAGALRSYLRAREFGFRTPHPVPGDKQWTDEQVSSTVALFGGMQGDDAGLPSPLFVDDGVSDDRPPVVEVRDHVSLAAGSATAREKHLFSVECWAAGTTFPLRFELHISEHDSFLGDRSLDYYRRRMLEALCGALEGFEDGGITIGGRRRRGFGKVKARNWTFRHYDLSAPDNLFAWLSTSGEQAMQQSAFSDIAGLRGALATRFRLEDLECFKDERRWAEIDLDLVLDGSILIRTSGGSLTGSPDDVHLFARGKDKGPVVSGTSLAGAFRAQARAIGHTILKHDTRNGRHPGVEELVQDVFGRMPEKGDRQQQSDVDVSDPQEHENQEPQDDEHQAAMDARGPLASRFETRQSPLGLGTRSTDKLIQQAVSIDRLSAGSYPGALFDVQPVFSDPHLDGSGHPLGGHEGAGAEVRIRLLDPEPEHIGLGVLVARDLYEGRLVIGGESSGGRGIFKGERFEFCLHEGRIVKDTWTAHGAITEEDYIKTPEEITNAIKALVDHLNRKPHE